MITFFLEMAIYFEYGEILFLELLYKTKNIGFAENNLELSFET